MMNADPITLPNATTTTATLRDQFAMQAMIVAAMLIESEPRREAHQDGTFPARLAKEAYRIADAMMKKREGI